MAPYVVRVADSITNLIERENLEELECITMELERTGYHD
jgi:hypothetical protein